MAKRFRYPGSKWWLRRMRSGERIIRHGGNQTGEYIIVETLQGSYRRVWEDGRQESV